MRVLFGMILGALLLAGVCFVSDTWSTGPATANGSATRVEHRTMVNWDVVGENLNILSARVRDAWHTISRKVTG
jgi:hypothetical protein